MHGSRMNRKQDFLKISIIISAASSSSGDRKFIIHIFQHIQNDVSDDSEVFGRMILSHSRMVFAESNVQAPMERVFNAPMTSSGVGELCYIQ